MSTIFSQKPTAYLANKRLEVTHLVLLWKKMVPNKLFKIDIDYIFAAGIIVFATFLRIVLISYGWPATESDEGAFDVMALHIAYQGEHPIFVYGQNYMGVLDSYLGARLIPIFGISVFSVRIGIILLFALFMISMYLLIRLLYTPKFALCSLILLSLGNTTMFERQLKVLDASHENLFFGATAVLLASWLALSHKRVPTRLEFCLRLGAYSLLGLVMGAALWSDLLVLPFLVMIVMFLLLIYWQETVKWLLVITLSECLTTLLGLVMRVPFWYEFHPGPFFMIVSISLLFALWRKFLKWPSLAGFLLGFLVGAAPLIKYNSMVPPGQDTWTAVQGVRYALNFHLPLAQGIRVVLLDTLPNATGAYPSCPIALSPLPEHIGPHGIGCELMYTGWAIGAILLWILAMLLVVVFLWKLYSRARTQDVSFEEKQELIRNLARLMPLGSVALTLILCAISPQTAVVPFRSVRYLALFFIASPAVIWPLWVWGSRMPFGTMGPIKVRAIFSRSLLLLIGLILLLSTLNVFSDISNAQATDQQQSDLIHNLTRIHAMHIYADYQSCYWIIFATNEHIICSPLEGSQLQPFNKYALYGQIVTSDPHSAYVFPLGSPQATTMAQKVAMIKQHYQHFEFDGYIVYKLPFVISVPV